MPRSTTNLERLTILWNTGLLDSPAEEAFDRLTQLAAKVLNAPISLISLVDKNRQFFKSVQGPGIKRMNVRETPLTHSFCQYVVDSNDPLIIYNAKEHPLVKENLAVSELGVIAYVGIPLTLSSGFVMGAFCVIDFSPRRWMEVEIFILRDLASMVIKEIELKWALNSREEILQIVSFQLKNAIASISLNNDTLLRQWSNGPEKINNQKMIDLLSKGKTFVKSMGHSVCNILDTARYEQGPIPVKKEKHCLDEILNKVEQFLELDLLERHISLKIIRETRRKDLYCDENILLKILSNLISNGLGLTHSKGELVIKIEDMEKEMRFSVIEPQIVISEEIIAKLFEKYWQTLVEDQDGFGLGLFIISRMVTAHGGIFSVSSLPEKGTEMTFTVPDS